MDFDGDQSITKLLPSPTLLLTILLLLSVLPRSIYAQPVQPSPMPTVASGSRPTPAAPILSAFGGLSDGGPVLSPYIDRLAFNARADLLFLADTPERRQAFVIPYGFSFAARHVVEGGIYTHHAFWKEGERSHAYNAPLGFNLKVRLWRWFSKDPNRHFTVVAAYQHEVRTGPFDGPNQLGLLTDLAALRIAASWPVWLFDIGASVGALYDYQGRFAIGELGARLGARLDFIHLEDTRASLEGIVRGVPAYAKSDAALPGAIDMQKSIGLSGALFFGINTRMTKTADFGIWAQKGFGDVAPLSFGARVFGIFIGEGYLRPRPIWAEVVKEIAIWIKEQVSAIDPVFRKDCVAYDTEDHHNTPMGRYGKLSEDGKFCESQGYKVPVGVDLFRNPKGTILCWDKKLRDCLLRRENPNAPWIPIHRPRLDLDCVLRDSDGSPLERLGEPAGDRKTCHWRAKDQHGSTIDRELEIGRLYHADSGLHRVCFNEDLTGCFVDRGDHDKRWTGLQQAAANFGLGIDEGVADYEKTADTAKAVASGKVNVKTIAQQAAEAAEHSIDLCASEGVACAKRIFNDALQAGWKALEDGEQWVDKPTQEKINDVMRASGKAGVKTPASLAAGVATGGVTQAVGGAIEHELEKAVANAAKRKTEKALAKKAGRAVGKLEAQVAEHVVPPAKVVEGSLPKGGTYLLVDQRTGKVMRTGRTKDLERRKVEHQRDPETRPYPMKEDKRTDNRSEQRGREQMIHDAHQPPLDKINPISPKNPQRQQYLDAAKRLDEE